MLLLHANHVLKRRPALRLARFGTLLLVAFVLMNVLALATIITLRLVTFYFNDVTSVPAWLVLLNLAQWVLVLAVPILLVLAAVYWGLAYVAMQSVLQEAQRFDGLLAEPVCYAPNAHPRTSPGQRRGMVPDGREPGVGA